MSVALVVLAAGASSRLGYPKQLVPYRGTTLLRHTISVALASACTPVIVVLGAFAERILPEIASMPVHVVLNDEWREGMGSSLRAGIAAVKSNAPQVEAVIFTVCDQPFLSTVAIDRLQQRYRDSGSPIVASAYAGELGVPALFERSLFDRLALTHGGDGAKNIIRQYPHAVSPVPFPEGEIDIDTVQDRAMLALDSSRCC